MMNNKKRNANAIIIMLSMLLLAMVGCKTKQKVATAPSLRQTETTPDMPRHAQTMKPQIVSLNYQWISYRMNLSLMDYPSKKEIMSVSAFFVNRKDSIIYITISKLGIEGARAVITPDTVKFINHLTSEYYLGDYTFLEQLLGFKVSFAMLQSLFMGEDVAGFEPNCRLTIVKDTNIYTSSSRKNKETGVTIAQELKTDSAQKVIENNMTELATQTFIGMRYWDFTNIDSQAFFQQAEALIPSQNKMLQFNIKNIRINVPGPVSIQIPAKYKPISIK
jgi:hypothetical protein